MNFECGLRLRKARLPEDALREFLVYEARLLDNLSHEDRFGSTETTRADRQDITPRTHTCSSHQQ